jgi:hypothetical protein
MGKLVKTTSVLWGIAALIALAIAVGMLNRDRPTFGFVAGDPSELYIEIKALMDAGEWKAANTAATSLALAVAGRANAGWFDRASIKHFPCSDLFFLDALFSTYSGGRFGIRAQHEVFSELAAADLNADADTLFQRFADAVGWRQDGEWLGYADLFQDVDSAPRGHLPIAAPREAYQTVFKSRTGTPDRAGNYAELMHRLEQCAPATRAAGAPTAGNRSS